METEKSLFAKKSVPRYTFYEDGMKNSSMNCRKFYRFFCAALLIFIILVALIIIFIYVHKLSFEKNVTNNTQKIDHVMKFSLPLLQEEEEEEEEKEKKFSQKAPISVENQKNIIKRGLKSLYLKEQFENDFPVLPIDSPAFRSQLATYTLPEAQVMSRLGYLMNFCSKEINRLGWNNSNTNTIQSRKWLFDEDILPKEVCENKFYFDCNYSIYRTADGTCNNIKHKSWGSALKPFRRILFPKYNDEISEPRKALDGTNLPSARKISLTIHRPGYANDVNFTVMLAVWGQFIDHDITSTALSKGKNGASISCCNNYRKKHLECFPIILEKSDPFYVKYNTTCMEFVRSAPAPLCRFGPREQINQVTSYLDGSVVYGSSKRIMNKLRAFNGGELKMLKTSFGELLPIANDPNDGCNMAEEIKRGRYCFLSGDARSNENLLLTSMHLLFARQHNLITRKLKQINPKFSDEKLFQESRKILGAQIQHITYNEFLPSILPWNLMKHLNMTIKSSGYSQNYNSSINPEISNSFASAAFRFGHSLLPGLIQFLKHNSSHQEYLELHKMLFNPFKLYNNKFLTNLIKGLLNTSAKKADVFFNGEITQKLFKKKKDSCGLDLVSLNIQRGRDHGLPAYPYWRKVCGLKEAKSFDDLKGEIDANVLENLRRLYKSVGDVDLYTGALAEKPLQQGILGPTITCLLADQFWRLKIGDRFWYENKEEPQKFTQDQLNEIKKTTLAKIICNTSDINKSQYFAMKRIGLDNMPQNCKDFDYPNLDLWKEKI